MQAFQTVYDTLIAAAAPGGSRSESACFEGEAALTRLLTEINRTLLPARICVEWGDGTSTAFVVRNRRLRSAVSIGGCGAPGTGGALPPGLAQGGLSAEQATDFITWVRETTTSVGLRSITLRELEPGDDVGALGMSPARLGLAAGMALQSPPASDLLARIDAFVARHPTQVRAAYLLADEAVSCVHGVGQEAEHAVDILSHVTAPETPLAARLETEGTLVYPGGGSGPGGILIAGALGFACVVMLEDMTLEEALNAWSAARIAPAPRAAP